MKSTFAIRLIPMVAVLFILSCSDANRMNGKGKSKVASDTIVFKGIMHKGDGLNISVYYPSQGFDIRYSAEIRDSKFTIRYPKKKNEIITLRIEEAIRDNHTSIWAPKFIAEDTIIFECTMDSLLGQFLIPKDSRIIKGDLNIIYRGQQKEFFTYFDPKQRGLDSLDKKQSLLMGYNNIYAADPTSFNSVYGLYYLLYESHIPISDYSVDQVELINTYFNNISIEFEGNYYYELARQKINQRVAQTGDELKSFQLKDINSNAVDIKSYAEGKNLVLIEFWHSKCGPCREFNKTFKDSYKKYNKLGFEIISVSTEKSKNDWVTSSKEDSLSWVNLYAGINSEIENYFEIQAYPTRAIYDNQLRLIKFGRIGESELKEILKRNIPIKKD